MIHLKEFKILAHEYDNFEVNHQLFIIDHSSL